MIYITSNLVISFINALEKFSNSFLSPVNVCIDTIVMDTKVFTKISIGYCNGTSIYISSES